MSLKDHKGREITLENVIEKGSYFGEVAIMYKIKRTATVIAFNYCTFGKLNLETFYDLSKELKSKLK